MSEFENGKNCTKLECAETRGRQTGHPVSNASTTLQGSREESLAPVRTIPVMLSRTRAAISSLTSEIRETLSLSSQRLIR